MIELIVSDLDKTLLNDKKVLTNRTAEILRKCREKGIKIAFATARPERATKGFQKGVQPDYVIANNGATITCGGAILLNTPIPRDVCNALMSELTRMGDVTHLTVEAGDCLYLNYRGEPWDGEDWNPIYNDFTEALDADISKISIECKNPESIAKLIFGYPNLHLYANSGEDWCQVMHSTSTKMNAVLYLAELLSIPRQNIVAFGDDYNDVEMIQKAGTGVAVANAIDLVKEVADCVCPGNNDDGVARWLTANVLNSHAE